MSKHDNPFRRAMETAVCQAQNTASMSFPTMKLSWSADGDTVTTVSDDFVVTITRKVS